MIHSIGVVLVEDVGEKVWSSLKADFKRGFRVEEGKGRLLLSAFFGRELAGFDRGVEVSCKSQCTCTLEETSLQLSFFGISC